MRRKITLVFAAFAAMASTVWGQSAMPFLRADRNPATSAMGGAQMTSSLYNPAAVPFGGSDIVLSYQSWAPAAAKATHVNLLAGVRLGEKLGLTVLGAYQMGEPYQALDGSGNLGASFTPSELVAGLGAGYAFTDALSAGAQVKFARMGISQSSSYTAVAADVYVMYAAGALKVSGGISSIGTPVKSGDKSYGLPTSVTAGAGYDLVFGTSAVKVAADFDYFFSGGVGLGLGARYAFADMVFVRAGYHLGTDKAPIPSYASLGAGFKWAGFHVDLSFLMASASLGNTLCVGLGYSF